MNELMIFSNPEFGRVRTLEENGTVLFCGTDVARALGYSNPRDAVSRHCRGVVKRYGVSLTTNQRGKTTEQTVEMSFIPESDLYRLVFSSKLPAAERFTDWVTGEVLPSIRRNGMYLLPKDYPSALRALADAEEKRLALAAENERQAQVIAEFEPIRQYVDTILESQDALATSQIAADYGMSAQQLNKILRDEGVQHKVNGQWLLYKKHMNMGYTKSKTIQFTHSDGRTDTKLHTQWTQKGRLMIHNILEKRGIVAVMDRTCAS
nr:MAG TPA: repressor domain protein [Bacteriophage sp.]